MGDVRADARDLGAPASTGRRVARHAAERPLAQPYVGRRVARPVPVPPAPEPVAAPEPVPPYVGRRIAKVVPAPPVPAVTKAAPTPVEPIVEPTIQPAAKPSAPGSGGRRVASRRSRRRRVPSLPLLAGVAVLAVSAGGALQAVNPDFSGSTNGQRLVPASAMSGSSAVASANLLGGRGTVVSRDSDRLQAAADAKAKQRDAALSAFAVQAQKQAAQIKLHQWVLPVTPGVYHLTARFGDYSSLWAHFHTGLDFAAPTGTPIMAVAGGTITEVGYSGAYGNRTIETLPDGTELWYCHQNEFGTSVGATVKPGQVIGYVGSTGNVTGPHLHLEVHPGGGDPVDPYTALEVHGLQP
jgi:murein DD-endopeptidase MepM/ murein hydrolase activator NlpD